MDHFEAALRITNEPSRQRTHIESAAKIGAVYHNAVNAATSEIRYTPEGREKLTRRHAMPALRSLDELLTKVGMTQDAELRAAAAATEKAINEFAPPYANAPWGAVFDIELAKQMRLDQSIAGMLKTCGENDADIPPEYLDYARCAIRAPRGITHVDERTQNLIVRTLTGGVDLYSVALERAADAKMMVRNVALAIMSDVPIRVPELAGISRPLAELIQRGVGEALGKPLPENAPQGEVYRQVSDTTPLRDEGNADDAGFSREAVA